MKIVFSARFTRDLEAIQDYIAQNNPPAAYRLAQTIRQRVQHLGAHPNMGRPGRIAGTRELVIPGMPWIV
jgi:toxin ParE1/3/4